MKKIDLFTPIVKESRLNQNFKNIVSFVGDEPGKKMMEEVWGDYIDIDGNFIEQFQTTGFDARTFELYLSAYFSESGYEVKRNYDRPDFIICNNDINVAIEATTVGQSHIYDKKEFVNLSYESKINYLENELPMRLGSPLFSKLKEEYWELEQCKNIPFVIAMEAFFDENSLQFTSSSLIQYLYGIKEYGERDEHERLVVKSVSVEEHSYKKKKIPSGFFYLPGVENVSAVLFSNSGTFPKFKRMGYQKGYYSSYIKIYRMGTCYDYDPNAAKPKKFIYDLDYPPIEETWGQGLQVCYNPNAKIPLEKDFFIDAAQTYMMDGRLYSDIPKPFHPYASKTYVFQIGGKIEPKNDKIKSITESEFENLIKMPQRKLALVKEISWFKIDNFIATLVIDIQDKDYGYVILKKDLDEYEFYNLKNEIMDIETAINMLSEEMLKILDKIE